MSIARLLTSVLLALCATEAAAQAFREAALLARTSEPVFLGAKANAAAALERQRQAIGQMLPQVNASANSNTNRRDYYQRRPGADFVDSYNNNGAQLSLTQPLYRPSNNAAARQAETQLYQAEHQLAAAEQELLAKLCTAWFDAMAARDDRVFTARQVEATRQQWDILRRGVELGTASAPAAAEARAKFEQAAADKISAEMAFHVKTAALEQVIGPLRAFTPPYLSNVSRTQDLTTEALDTWLERLEQSPQLLAAVQGVAAADEEVKKQRALYEPTLDIVGSYGKRSQQVGDFPGQSGYDIVTGTIGLQLNIPLFAGGTHFAKVDEAIALREKAKHDLEATLRASRLATKQAWYGWLSANGRHGAAVQAARSALLALRAALIGIQSGVKTDLDRLQAVLQVEGARRDFNKARYDLIASFIRLKAVLGQLGDADLERIEQMFVEREADLQEVIALAN